MPASSEQRWTTLSVIEFSAGYLKSRGVPEPRLDAELMLAHALGWKRIDLYTRFDDDLPPDALAQFRAMLKRRGERVPVKYLLGETEFMSLRFAVAPAVLIPRPETEHLVERAVAHLKTLQALEPLVLDAGTGSGAIACAIVHHAPSARAVATDISPEALAVARANAETLGLAARIDFAECDMTRQLAPPGHGGPYHIIASNPPYIATAERDTLEPEVARHEPAHALFVDDPLGPTRSILQQAPALLAENGLLLIEIAHDAADAVTALIETIDGLELVEFVRDYGGHRRVAVARRRVTIQSTG